MLFLNPKHMNHPFRQPAFWSSHLSFPFLSILRFYCISKRSCQNVFIYAYVYDVFNLKIIMLYLIIWAWFFSVKFLWWLLIYLNLFPHFFSFQFDLLYYTLKNNYPLYLFFSIIFKTNTSAHITFSTYHISYSPQAYLVLSFWTFNFGVIMVLSYQTFNFVSA